MNNKNFIKKDYMQPECKYEFRYQEGGREGPPLRCWCISDMNDANDIQITKIRITSCQIQQYKIFGQFIPVNC